MHSDINIHSSLNVPAHPALFFIQIAMGRKLIFATLTLSRSKSIPSPLLQKKRWAGTIATIISVRIRMKL